MKSIIMAMLGITFAFTGRGQVFPEGEIANLFGDNILEMESWQNTNLAMIKQIGNNNELIALQQNSEIHGIQILSSQQGNGNLGYTRQSGDSHKTTLWQNGQKNVANLWQEGSLTDFEARQTGDENVINSYMKNASIFEKSAVLMQDGSNNRIDFAIFGDETPTASQAIKITQQGDGFVAKALMESSDFPIEITQKVGPGGGAMNVDVSVSYFSFPMK